jgi:hypothetical protein
MISLLRSISIHYEICRNSINYYHPSDDGDGAEEEVVDHQDRQEEVAVDHKDHQEEVVAGHKEVVDHQGHQDHHHKIELELDPYLRAVEKLL